MEEKWKALDFDARYEVSNLGNARRVQVDGSRTALQPWSNGQDYAYISIRSNGKRKVYRIHRLVAMAFCSGGKETSVVDHIDGDRRNNRADNLRWVDPTENFANSASAMLKIVEFICEQRDAGQTPKQILPSVWQLSHPRSSFNRKKKSGSRLPPARA